MHLQFGFLLLYRLFKLNSARRLGGSEEGVSVEGSEGMALRNLQIIGDTGNALNLVANSPGHVLDGQTS